MTIHVKAVSVLFWTQCLALRGDARSGAFMCLAAAGKTGNVEE